MSSGLLYFRFRPEIALLFFGGARVVFILALVLPEVPRNQGVSKSFYGSKVASNMADGAIVFKLR